MNNPFKRTRPAGGVVLENPETGELVSYTLEEARATIRDLEGRRDRLIEKLAEREGPQTPRQERRWMRQYHDAVNLNAAKESLENALRAVAP